MNPYSLLIGAADLLRRIDDPRLRLLDCRFNLLEPGEGHRQYREGHIPSAVYADLNKDLSGEIGPGTGRHPLPPADQLALVFGRFGIGSGTQVVVYDDSGGAIAARAWWLLRWLGHTRVAVLDGGIAAWRAAGGTLEPGEVRVRETRFEARPRADRVLETADIVSGLDDPGQMRLVDARDAARFQGLTEPLDTVAGHIPGSVNLPYSQTLNPDGTLRPPGQLRQLWSAALIGDPDAACAVTCGSGVTACHLVLSALLAGRREPRVYAGSWSEWIRDPSRPIATGAA